MGIGCWMGLVIRSCAQLGASGADVDAVNAGGLTAHDIAASLGFSALAATLVYGNFDIILGPSHARLPADTSPPCMTHTRMTHPPCHPTHAVCYVLLGRHPNRVLIGT